jgi:hypothetical protein
MASNHQQLNIRRAVSLSSILSLGAALGGCAGLSTMPLWDAFMWVVKGALLFWVLSVPVVGLAWYFRKSRGRFSVKYSLSIAAILGAVGVAGLRLLDPDLGAILFYFLLLLLFGLARTFSSDRSLGRLLLEMLIAAVALGLLFLLDVRGPRAALSLFRFLRYGY